MKHIRSLIEEIFPTRESLIQLGRHIFARNDHGPLHRLGLHAADLKNLTMLPHMKRARNFHLYDVRGLRYLDLYRTDGYELLGYSIPGYKQTIKDRLSQALWQGFPHHMNRQLIRKLEAIFPKHVPLVCPDRYRVLSVLEFFDIKPDRPLLPLSSDLVPPDDDRALHIWFPFTGKPGRISLALFPSAGFQGPYVLLVEKELYAHHVESYETKATGLETVISWIGNNTPPFSAHGLLLVLNILEALGAFILFETSEITKNALGTDLHPRTRDLKEALGQWRESFWSNIDCGTWKRWGPYISHEWAPEVYADVFRNALEKGIVLNPRSSGISILPGMLSKGEQKNLEAVLNFCPEKYTDNKKQD